MSFVEDVYPWRTRLPQLTAVLLNNIDRHWTRVEQVAGMQDRPGFILRCRAAGSEVACNYAPTPRDKMRVRAILRGWRRTISDRYLDYQSVKQFEYQGFGSSVATAFAAIRQNAPTGAVRFIQNELPRERTGSVATFFGSDMFDNYSYNIYFTLLLKWCDFHCYGLIRELETQEHRYHGAGGSSIHPVWQAARNWLRENQGRGVYSQYNLQIQ